MDKDKSLLKILTHMDNNKRKNNGVPIVAVVFNDDLDIIFTQSNKRIEKKYYDNKIHEKHAEWLCMNEIEYYYSDDEIKNDLNLNIIITTTPCNHCAKRIKKFNFKNIYFLTHKLDVNNDHDWKKINPIPINYTPKNSIEENLIKKMADKFYEANWQNRQKTIQREILNKK